MDVAGTAVGIVSLGIQVCQSLLDYYDKWKDYSEDLASTLRSIEQTKAALSSLESLCDKIDSDKAKNVISAAQACNEHILKLQKKVKKLRTYEEPKGWREMLITQLQKTWYPLRHDTLEKLRKTATEIQGQLSLSLQILDLDLGKESQETSQNILARIDDVCRGIEKVELQTQETQKLLESNQFRDAVHWLDAVDPQTDYKIARSLREDGTGYTLVGSKTYSEWKQGSTRHLWIYGKAGCGKSIASATVIEDIETYCRSHVDTGYAMFYFTYNNTKKQSYGDCLRSLVSQISDRQPTLSLLLEAHKASRKDFFEEKNMEEVIISALKSLGQFYLVLDALDESPEHFVGKWRVRQKLLHGLSYLSEKAANLKIVATSRRLEDIEDQITKLRSLSRMDLAEYINQDIRKYIESQLAEDSHLCLLNQSMKSEIMDKLLAKADGMFRWIYCQMQDLKTLQSSRPTRIRAVLDNLPLTLDETYNRMLERIQPVSRQDALVYLRWLAYAQEPLTLNELAETVIIDVSTPDGIVNMDDRGSIKDIQQLLSGLILIYDEKKTSGRRSVSYNEDDSDDEDVSYYEDSNDGEDGSDGETNSETPKRVRLAHYSVKEYLESRRIMDSRFGSFHLNGPAEKRNVANGCLIYLQHYAKHELATGTKVDLDSFPLLQYAARQWYTYPNDIDTRNVATFLRSQENIESWMRVHKPEYPWQNAFEHIDYKTGNGMYCAGYLGLGEAVKAILLDSDVNTAIGQHGSALMAATMNNHVEVVKILIEQGRANVNSQVEGGSYGTALIAAVLHDRKQAMQLLIANGADVNTQTQYGYYGTALIAAAARDHKQAMQLLIANGADVNTQTQYGDYGIALIAAAASGHEQTIQVLIANGADVNTQTQHGFYGTALIAAAAYGHEQTMQVLIANGADVNTQTQHGNYGAALIAAATSGHEQAMQVLIANGVDVNTQTQYGNYGTALIAAVVARRNAIVEALVKRYGADVNAWVSHGKFNSALIAATSPFNYDSQMVTLLIGLGADANDIDADGMNILQIIACHGDVGIFQNALTLEEYDLRAKDRHGRTILHSACISGNLQLVELILHQLPSLIMEDSDMSSWTILHWACQKGSFGLLKLLNDAGCRTRVIETKEPAVSWAPLDIAIYYRNFQLITQDGNLVESHDWRSVLSSGIVQLSPTVDGSRVVAVRENRLAAQSDHWKYCDGCHSNIPGLFFYCTICRDYDYCLMCIRNFKKTHPGHEYKCREQGKQKRSFVSIKCIV